MDARIFGREITNLEPDLNRYKRNYSFLHGERAREASLHHKQGAGTNRVAVRPQQEQKPIENRLESEDPQMVPEYFFENMQFLRSREKLTHSLTNYLPTHRTVSEQSRAKLIDWLSELHYKYKMFPETLFSMVALIDQYLAAKEVPLAELQLVGVAALYIAAKFEETYQVPQVKQLVTCCANQFTAAEILEMEASIIKHLNFELIINSAYKFFEPLCKVIGLEPKNQHLAQYVLELALLQPKFLNYSPSLMASSAIYLIKKIRKSESSWSETMTALAGYREQELKTCAKDLCNLLEGAGEL